MVNSHRFLLKELKIAIDKLPVTVPKEVVDRALNLYKELSENESVTEGQIHDTLVSIGKDEFAYRRAFQDMVGASLQERINDMVLEHVEPNVKNKLDKYLKSGVTLDEFVSSELFETEFSGEERHQIEDGILDAQDHIKKEMPEIVEKKKDEYEALLKKWQEKQKVIQAKIDELKELSKEDPKWKDEILDKVKTFEEGWSVVERDPDLVEIEKEIEYWRGTIFAEE